MHALGTDNTALDTLGSLARALGRHIPQLRAIKRRRTLTRSGLYARIAGELDRVTRGLEHGTGPRARARAQRGFIRVAAWNIERGKRLDSVARYLADSDTLRRADVLLVPEVDIGMARSGNRNVAAELAHRLGYDYVFGNSYLCLDRGNVRDGASDASSGDNALGLHGNAIFSRFPITRAENFSIAITKDKFHSSEKRLGHKKALWAELDTPLGALPVVVVHLDSGASPRQRGRQMESVVDKLEERGLADRVLVGGDFNTTTYDVKSPLRIAWNLLLKFARGGFPHAIHHYVHPHELYVRPVFAQLERLGLDYGDSYNPPGVGTSRYDIEDPDAQSKVLDYMPRFALDILRRKLRPWNGVAPFKLDWFAGRGLRPLQAAEAAEADGTRSVAPTVIEKPTRDGKLLSDHDAIVVDLAVD